MEEYNEKEAGALAQENDTLRLRLLRLEEQEIEDDSDTRDEVTCANMMKCNSTNPNASRVDKIKDRNSALREEIDILSEQLDKLKQTNVTELYHEFLRLDQRRGQLLGENRSLHNILSNQHKHVELAANKVHEHDELRRQNEEYNLETKADTAVFRDKRVEILSEIKQLMKKESLLQTEMLSIPSTQAEYNKEVETLKDVIVSNNKQLEELKMVESKMERRPSRNSYKNYSTDIEEISSMRKHYVELKDKIKQLQEEREK